MAQVESETKGSSTNEPESNTEALIATLPTREGWSTPLTLYNKCWLRSHMLRRFMLVRDNFKPRRDDIILATHPKSGTTWLKALAFATLNRADHPPCGLDHPLRRSNPHDCVDFLEVVFLRSAADDVLAALPSPRVIATHMPCSLLPERVIAEPEGAGCKTVYICRDPKDALVSMWQFTKKRLAFAVAALDDPPKPYTIDEMFELFCDGRCTCGPQWHHILGYWEASRRQPEKVLFLRYEDMLGDPVGNVRKLAEFTGCAFSEKEEAAGVAQDIVELCSIDALKNMEVNKNEVLKFCSQHPKVYVFLQTRPKF